MAKEQGPIVVAGKRKMAVARAVVSRGNGIVRVNRRPLEIWMPELARLKIQEPLVIAGERAQGVDIDVQIRGGGVMGQADAARTAIARGLVRFAHAAVAGRTEMDALIAYMQSLKFRGDNPSPKGQP